MHEACDFRNLLFKDTQRVRVRHHHAGDVVAKKRFEVFHVNRSVGRALHLYDLQTADGGRGRIGAVSRVGHDDLCAACVAPFHVVRTYHHEARQFAVSSGVGVQGEAAQSGNFRQGFLHLVVEFQRALAERGILCGVNLRKSRQCGQLLVDFRIILHRAAAQGVEARVHAEVVARHIRVVSHHGQFVRFRQFGGRCLAHQVFRQGRELVLGAGVMGQRVALSSGFGQLKYQRGIYSAVHERTVLTNSTISSSVRCSVAARMRQSSVPSAFTPARKPACASLLRKASTPSAPL